MLFSCTPDLATDLESEKVLLISSTKSFVKDSSKNNQSAHKIKSGNSLR